MSWSRQRKARPPGSLWWTFKRVIYFLWIAFLTLLIPFLLICGWYAWKSSDYDLTEVKRIPARTILLDRHGKELDTIHGANRRLLENQKVPSFFRQALLAREDQNFMEHGGVDLRGLVRATLRNLRDLDFTQGASTLTMQLARNSFDLHEKKSLNRKFLEIALTYRIEEQFTKEEILTHYLNRIYFGAGCHGLEEAALTYFGVNANDLNRHQSAMLAGIIRGPHAFSPLRNLAGAEKQRDEVLARLLTLKKIDEVDLQLIKRESLNLQNTQGSLSNTSHAARALRRPLEKALDRTKITVGGLEVISTIDQAMQKSLENLFEKLDLPAECQIAAIAMQPKTGDILGIVGTRGSKPTGFNRALDARRGLGAIMVEPFINTCALERGHVPVSGKPVVTARQLGEPETLKLLKRFGFEGKFGSGDDLFRGTMTASPLEITTGLSTILNDGLRPTPRFILQVKEAGHELYHLESASFPAFSKDGCPDELPELLIGTSPSRADVWGGSISRERVVIAWMGYDQPKKIVFTEEARILFRNALKNLPR